jgi:hypothetical protein
MAKADLSDDVIKIAIGAILIGGIYLIYTTARAGGPAVTLAQQTGSAVQKPFTWAAEGIEYGTGEIVSGWQWILGGAERRTSDAYGILTTPSGSGTGSPNWAKRRQESGEKSWLKGEEGIIPDWIY